MTLQSICIDESGITSKTGHSTFALAYIEYQNESIFDKQVLEIESKFNLKSIHWSSMSWKLRKLVVNELVKLDFNSRVCVFRNPINIDNSLLLSIKYLVLSEDRIKNIYIDGDKPEKFVKKIKNILRSKNLSVRNIKAVPDEKFGGLRVADFVAGATRYFYDNESNENIKEVFSVLKSRISVTHINDF